MSSRDTLQSKVARACGGLLRSRTLWRVRSLRVACAPCPMRGARKTAPRIHAAEAGAGTTANRRRSWPQHSRTPQARAPPRFRARRENLRRIDSAAVLAPRKAAKENPARLQACGVYRWGVWVAGPRSRRYAIIGGFLSGALRAGQGLPLEGR